MNSKDDTQQSKHDYAGDTNQEDMSQEERDILGLDNREDDDLT